jgi:hypothetical protein
MHVTTQELRPLSAGLLLITTAALTFAQLPKAEIQKKLESEYALTQPTGDNTDIVTAGAILVIKKGPIMMVPVANNDIFQNTYKDGKVSQNAIGKSTSFIKGFHVPGVTAPSTPDHRKFVPGEKLWVTKIDVRDDGVTFSLFTDAFNDVRYKAAFKFQFPKGVALTTDQVDTLVAEVFKVQPADDAKDAAPAASEPSSKQPAPAPAPSAAPPPPPAPKPEPAAVIPPPPPPPPADPVSISKGQTKDQVVAAFGQPTKIVKLGAKEIYIYPEVKVTFASGKVSDVQ